MEFNNNSKFVQNAVNGENLTYITGHSADFHLNKNDCDIKIDVLAFEHYGVRIWGQIKDNNGKPIPNVLVKLVKPTYTNGYFEYIGVSHCISDLEGFYQFQVSCKEDDAAYKIIVSRNLNSNESCNCNE